MGERGNTPFGGQVLQYETFEKCHFDERGRRDILMMTVC